jgi:hypothetical protein
VGNTCVGPKSCCERRGSLGERTRGGVPNDPASNEVSRLKKFGIYAKQYA